MSCQFEVCSGLAEEKPDRWQVAEYLFDRRGHHGWFADQSFHPVREIGKAHHGIGNQVFSGLLPGSQQQRAEFDQLVLTQAFAVHFSHAQ